jgi:uncharacterized protein YceH (UPF0502 family)
MIQLTPDESRVLGVLIEKALTTPDQYPLSLNATVNGCNQKNNRDPVLAMDEDATLDALESLRGKGLVVRVDSPGSRVHKYRHNAGDALHARTAELAILAELLLRGPQTLGELRGRASRMQPLESLEVVKGMLTALEQREEPLVRELPRSPGSRAEQYAQLLCVDLHPAPTAAAAVASDDASIAKPASSGLGDRVAALESEVATLKDAIRKLAAALGEGDPLSPE